MTTTVTVYSKELCQQCRATERWLNTRGIPFTHEDATNPTHAARLRALGYQQAPVVFVTSGDTEAHWSGFNPTELERHLGEWRAAS